MSEILVSRRSFMKGTGAAVLAAACSGMLTGCSGSGSGPADKSSLTEPIGEYTVTINASKASYGWVDSDSEGFIIPDIKIKGVSNSVTLFKPYTSIFDISVDGSTDALKLSNPLETANIVQGMSTSCLPKYTTKDQDLYNALKNGDKAMEISITLSASTKTFIINLANKTVEKKTVELKDE